MSASGAGEAALVAADPAARGDHLRDVLGLDSAQVCRLLDISVANQRVLLHRGGRRAHDGLCWMA